MILPDQLFVARPNDARPTKGEEVADVSAPGVFAADLAALAQSAPAAGVMAKALPNRDRAESLQPSALARVRAAVPVEAGAETRASLSAPEGTPPRPEADPALSLNGDQSSLPATTGASVLRDKTGVLPASAKTGDAAGSTPSGPAADSPAAKAADTPGSGGTLAGSAGVRAVGADAPPRLASGHLADSSATQKDTSNAFQPPRQIAEQGWAGVEGPARKKGQTVGESLPNATAAIGDGKDRLESRKADQDPRQFGGPAAEETPRSTRAEMATSVRLPQTAPPVAGAALAIPGNMPGLRGAELSSLRDGLAPLGEPDLPAELATTAPQSQQSATTGAPRGIVMAQAAPPAMIQQIAVALTQASDGRIEVALTPEDLGRVRLRIDGREGAWTVTVLTDRAETLDTLRKALPDLAASFAEAGYDNPTFTFGEDAGADEDDQPAIPFVGGQVHEQTATPSARLAPTQGLDIKL